MKAVKITTVRPMFSLNNTPIQKFHSLQTLRPKAEVLYQHHKEQCAAVEDTAGFKLSPNSGASASWFWFRSTSNTRICVFHVKYTFSELSLYLIISCSPGSRHYPAAVSFALFFPTSFASADSGVPACSVNYLLLQQHLIQSGHFLLF